MVRKNEGQMKTMAGDHLGGQQRPLLSTFKPSEAGGSLLTVLLGMAAVGGASALISEKTRLDGEFVRAAVARQSLQVLEEELRTVSASIGALEVSASHNTSLGKCVKSGATCSSVTSPTSFDLYSAFGEKVGGTNSSPALYSYNGGRCLSGSHGCGFYKVETAFTTHCAGGSATCEAADKVTVYFEIKNSAGTLVSQGSQDVAAYICPTGQGLVGYDGKGAPACAPIPTAPIVGPSGYVGNVGPRGASGAQGAKGDQGYFIDMRGKMGCYVPETEVQLADGQHKRIRDLNRGDRLKNPVTGRSYRIRKMVKGPEQEPIIELGYGDFLVQVTQKHPMATRLGVKMAKDVTQGDELLGVGGIFFPVRVRRELPLNPRQEVYNVVLDGDSLEKEHWLLVGRGIVSGDLWLQEKVERQDNLKNSDLSFFEHDTLSREE